MQQNRGTRPLIAALAGVLPRAERACEDIHPQPTRVADRSRQRITPTCRPAFLIPVVLLALGACQKSPNENGIALHEETVDTLDTSSPEASSAQEAMNNSFSAYLRTRGGVGTVYQIKISKTDGQPRTVDGTEGYRMFVDVVVTLPNGLRPECTRSGTLCIQFGGLKPTGGPTVLSYDGNIDFSKTEKSWIIKSMYVDFNTPKSESVDQPPAPDNTALSGTWKFNSHSEYMANQPWEAYTAKLAFSSDKVTGTLNGDAFSGEIDGDITRIIYLPNGGANNGSITYHGNIDREHKTMAGTWQAFLGNHGSFNAELLK